MLPLERAIRQHRILRKQIPIPLQSGYDTSVATGQALYAFAQQHQLQRVVEFGSDCGIASGYLGLGMPVPAVLYVLEPCSGRAAIADKALARLLPGNTFWEIVPQLWTHSAPSIMPRLRPIDYTHIDGDGRADLTIRFFELALACSRPNGFVSGLLKGRAMAEVLQTLRGYDRIVREFSLGERIVFEVR